MIEAGDFDKDLALEVLASLRNAPSLPDTEDFVEEEKAAILRAFDILAVDLAVDLATTMPQGGETAEANILQLLLTGFFGGIQYQKRRAAALRGNAPR